MGRTTVCRDAITGEWVSPEYAAEHPDTTVTETVDDRSQADVARKQREADPES